MNDEQYYKQIVVKHALETISNKISRYYVHGDMVDCIGWHAVPRTATVICVRVTVDESAGILKCHEMKNFTTQFMQERFRRLKK